MLPSSVQTISSSLKAASFSVQKARLASRKPTMQVVRLPASLKARSCGKTGATPRPPPTSTTWPGPLDVLRQAQRADEVEKLSPSL
jgi:hypothetical protein